MSFDDAIKTELLKLYTDENQQTLEGTAKEKLEMIRPKLSYDLLGLINDLYTYVYIPVEGYVDDLLMLNRREMQDLMGEDITKEIDNALKRQINQGKSVIDLVNESLDTFINGINEKVKKTDEKYSFNVPTGPGNKKKLTASDVRQEIVEAYFNIRTLKKDKKEISELSSGEQRKAIIDLATAFLDGNNNNKKSIILAIDEPEASMHVSACFEQFERLSNLAQSHQCLITTHWYGFLPTIQKGSLHYVHPDDRTDDDIDKKNEQKIISFDLSNYIENARSFPDDVDLKSYFDLTASAISLMKRKKCNWVFCEGSDDVNYLTAHLGKDKINELNLRIIPAGGISNVIKIYQYLHYPFNENTEKKNIDGKILCITDTDLQSLDIEYPNREKSNLAIKRLQVNSNSVELVNHEKPAGNYSATCIEDALEPATFFECAEKIAKDSLNQEVINAISKVIIKPSQNYSMVFADDCWIDTTSIRNEIREFVSKNKSAISMTYLNSFDSQTTKKELQWVSDILNFFTEGSSKTKSPH